MDLQIAIHESPSLVLCLPEKKISEKIKLSSNFIVKYIDPEFVDRQSEAYKNIIRLFVIMDESNIVSM